MSDGAGGPLPPATGSDTEHEYRLRQPIGDGRRTITLRMPTGWARAALSGVEAALLGWGVPALLGVFGLLAQGANPWLQEVDVSVAAALGTDFWALSLGAPMSLGGLPISLIPLLWTIAQVLILRGLLIGGRNNQPSAQWWAVPTYALTSVIVLMASPGLASVSAVLIGATGVALTAAGWAAISQTRNWPAWTEQLGWLWSGLRFAGAWFGVVFLTGTVAAAASAFASWGAMQEAGAVLGATGFSAILLGLTQAAYTPVFSAWGLAWLAGPGFVLNPDQVSSPTRVAEAVLPLFPVAQMVPSTAPGAWMAVLVVAAAVVVGALCGWRLRQRGLEFAAGAVAVSLLGFAFAVGAWFALATGALGDERMARLGPVTTAWPMVVIEFGLTAALVALALNKDLHLRLTRFVSQLQERGHATNPAPGAQDGETRRSRPSRAAAEAPDSVEVHPGPSAEASQPVTTPPDRIDPSSESPVAASRSAVEAPDHREPPTGTTRSSDRGERLSIAEADEGTMEP